MSYVNKRPYCSLEHVFMGSLGVELVLLLFAFFFFLIKSEQKSLFLQHWELWETRRCVAAVVSWKRHNDHVSKVLMLMG